MPINQIEQRMRAIEYFRDTPIPDLHNEYERFNASEPRDKDKVLDRFGIKLSSTNLGNILYIHKGAKRAPSEAEFRFSGSNNAAILDKDCTYAGMLQFIQDDNLAVIFGGQSKLGLNGGIRSGSTLIWGKRSFAFGVTVAVQSNTVCTIGDDCLFSSGIWMRTTDHHSIIDLNTLKPINSPEDVTIGNHVWIGQDCLVLKGVRIGDGSIIGARSTVASYVPKTELWAGSPARMLKSNVSWIGSHPVPDPSELQELFVLLKLDHLKDQTS